MMAVGTSGRFSGFDRHRTALYPEDLPADEDIGDLLASCFDNPAKCLPRNVHPGSSLLLIQPLEIGQPQCLIFVEVQKHLFYIRR